MYRLATIHFVTDRQTDDSIMPCIVTHSVIGYWHETVVCLPCSKGHFLFTCSDTFAVGCIVQPQYTSSQTDRQTDDIIMPCIVTRSMIGYWHDTVVCLSCS